MRPAHTAYAPAHTAYALLDQYLADRRRRGAPLPDEQLEAAARYVEQLGGYGEPIAAAIRARMVR